MAANTPVDSSSPTIPPEKSIVLKGWEKLDDDVIIKEVSTKGKHVNLCIQYLAERNELSMKEAKNYFLQKVRGYHQPGSPKNGLHSIDQLSKAQLR